jgi:hypothetical protein
MWPVAWYSARGMECCQSAMCTECNQHCMGKACSELERPGRTRLWGLPWRRGDLWIISVCLFCPNCFRKLSGRSQNVGEGLRIRTMSVSRIDFTYQNDRGSNNRSKTIRFNDPDDRYTISTDISNCF